MAITVPLCEVEPVRTPRPPEAPLHEALERLTGAPVEACGAASSGLHAVRHNALLAAVYQAFAEHHPLVLTPDVVWLCIAQGFAAHVARHAEALRGRFVRHAGRVPLTVRRDDFIKDSPANPWPEVFTALSDQIALHIGRQRDLVVCDYSTTGPCERAASEIVLLDSMQHYFQYLVKSLCGIPEITLAGTVDDWRRLRHRAAALAEYGLEWWTDLLVPALGEFVAAAEGRPDHEFWRHIFKERSGSGGTRIRGWIHLLFPYITDGTPTAAMRPNHILEAARGQPPIRPGGGPAKWVTDHELSPDVIPLGLSRAPFVWEYLGERVEMELLGGLVGLLDDPVTRALRPAAGWAVRPAGAAATVVRGPTAAEVAALREILQMRSNSRL